MAREIEPRSVYTADSYHARSQVEHVDLTQTGLQSRHLVKIAGMLRYSAAVVALHLRRSTKSSS